jgi:hypothetical protein
MSVVVEYISRSGVASSDAGFGSGGGVVDDIYRRLGHVEEGVADLREQVRDLKTKVEIIAAIIPTLATKADIAIIPTLATKVDLANLRTEVQSVRTLRRRGDD